MPLKIIRQDVTKIECDAIVHPTNRRLLSGGVGKAVIAPAVFPTARFVIRTVGPSRFFHKNYRELLASCYRACLQLAVENNCESVAFPLIGAGALGCPTAEVLRIATKVIGDFLYENEMLVYLAVYDKRAFDLSQKAFAGLSSFIHDHYVNIRFSMYTLPPEPEEGGAPLRKKAARESAKCKSAEGDVAPACKSAGFAAADESLDDMIRRMDKGFADTLFFYIDQKGVTDVDAYKRSNVDKKTFSKIKCNPGYKPSKVTAVSFAIGLKLSAKETGHLLSTAGFCLSNNSLFDVIIRYFVTTGKYESIFDVNEVLYSYDQVTLGV